MNGSTLIHTNDPSILFEIASDMEALEKISHISLDTLATIDFVELVATSGIEWNEGEPEAFDEESGVAIFQVNPPALQALVLQKDGLSAEQRADLEKIEKFISTHGNSNIYELATF